MGGKMESKQIDLIAMRKHYKDIVAARDVIYRRFRRFFWNDGKIIELMNLDADMELVLSSISSFYERAYLKEISDLRDKVGSLEEDNLELKRAADESKPKRKPAAKRKAKWENL